MCIQPLGKLRKHRNRRLRFRSFRITDLSRSSSRTANARLVPLPGSGRRGRIPERKASVAVDTLKSHKDLGHFRAAHALNRVTPQTFDSSDSCHIKSHSTLQDCKTSNDGSSRLGRLQLGKRAFPFHSRFLFVVLRVTSWIAFLQTEEERSTKSHEVPLNIFVLVRVVSWIVLS